MYLKYGNTGFEVKQNGCSTLGSAFPDKTSSVFSSFSMYLIVNPIDIGMTILDRLKSDSVHINHGSGFVVVTNYAC